jgi:hypothetical protein
MILEKLKSDLVEKRKEFVSVSTSLGVWFIACVASNFFLQMADAPWVPLVMAAISFGMATYLLTCLIAVMFDLASLNRGINNIAHDRETGV